MNKTVEMMNALCDEIRACLAEHRVAGAGFAVIIWSPGEASDPGAVCLAGSADTVGEISAALTCAIANHARAIPAAKAN